MGRQVTVTPNYRPHKKQMLLHNAPVSFEDIYIILYGGSRGGGKSAGILADAFMFCTKYPGAKCCILRESLDAVKQSFLDKLPTLFPQTCNGIKIYDYREKSTSWYPSRSIRFPNGSYITLQRVANFAEAKAKQGWEFNYLAIDEVTKQTEDTVNYLLSCVRSVKTTDAKTGKERKIPTKVVFGCNPGGPGHKWVKRRFIDPTTIRKDPVTNAPIETKDVVEYVQHPIKANLQIKSTIRFIPASYADNPFLSPAYVAMLLAQSEHQKQMDLYGNWDVVAGKMFDLHKGQRLKYLQVKREIARAPEVYLSIDWGYKPSYHSAHWYAILPDQRVICFQELYGQELIFEDFVQEIAKLSEPYNIAGTCLPHDMFRHGDRYRSSSGQIIGETKADYFEYYNLTPLAIASGKGKVDTRFDKLHSAMELKNGDGIYKFRITENCTALLEELDNAVYDDRCPEKIASACKDHALDDFGLFLMMYSDDICPIEVKDPTVKDTRNKLERLLDEDEEILSAYEDGSRDAFFEGNYY